MEFYCPHCSIKLATRPGQAGTVGHCPRCKREITMPQQSSPQAALDDGDDVPPAGLAKPLDPTMLDLTQPQEPGDVEQDVTSHAAPRESARDHLFPGPFALLSYPLSPYGLTNLVLIVGSLLLLRCGKNMGMFPGDRDAIVRVLALVYTAWYLIECVDHSAHGGSRAPKPFQDVSGSDNPGPRIAHLTAAAILFVAPAGIYYAFTRSTDVIFCALAAGMVLLLPMSLLVTVVLESAQAVNPLFLLRAISRTLVPYLCLAILLGASSVVLGLSLQASSGPVRMTWGGALSAFGTGYGALVLAHLLGRFYWRYEEQLDWDI